MIEKALARDGLSKVFAVILAIVVWIQVINDKNPLERKDFTIDVQVQNLAQGQVVIGVNPAKVTVTLEGRLTTISRIDPDKLKAVADLSAKSPDSNQVPLRFEPPNGVKLIAINPDQVTVDVDVQSTASVPCNIEIKGLPSEDFQNGAPVVTPATVTVRGPSRLTSKVQWATGIIDITGASQPVSATVSLIPRDNQGFEVKGVTLEPSNVQVQVPLISLPPAKSVPIRAKTTGSPKEGYRVASVTVTPEEVKVRAQQSQLNNLSYMATRPIDLSGKDSTFNILVNLDIPSGVTCAVSQVTVKVEIVENIVQRSFTVPVQITSYPSRLKWEIQPAAVEVVLSGRSDIISQIAERDVEAYIDAEGKSEGEYDMVVAVNAPSGVQIDVRPPKVKLILTQR